MNTHMNIMVGSNKQEDKVITSAKQEYKILAEYKMVESEKIGGVYVIPSYENSLLWFGVIFVRSGYYKNGIFRFNISLPDNFPDDKTAPTVIFQNEIIHPLIHPYTGALDISFAFPYWRIGEDHIWQLLKYISYIFMEPEECLKSTETFQNKNAFDLITIDIDEFKTKVAHCVQQSINNVYDPAPVDDPHYIIFERFNNELHGPVLNKMKLDGAKSIVPSAHATTSLSWVKEGEFKPLSKE
ncbi:protein crossbronx homolog [Condylostylus longicornis]|uniref:protein crossbronx homolog n=1 Tax=Condylostylus longicornis TaxID=2530218 RepID=UPI00244D9DD5|nr:protein crossbronx homolog [Condylostylus longicornis]